MVDRGGAVMEEDERRDRVSAKLDAEADRDLASKLSTAAETLDRVG
mgnify:FL=1